MADMEFSNTTVKPSKAKKIILAFAAIILVLAAAAAIYLSIYYKPDGTALAALESTESVEVTETDYGWFFDGPSEDTALVFYPGAKVDAASYAPLLQLLADSEMDVCLVKVPARMAILSVNKADKVMAKYNYVNWFVGGHSLGGYASEQYAAKHSDALRGVILFAARPRDTVSLPEIVLCGSKDNIVKPAENLIGTDRGSNVTVKIIEGGNHAQFGSYGVQKGDGDPAISAQAQREEAVRTVLNWLQENVRD